MEVGIRSSEVEGRGSEVGVRRPEVSSELFRSEVGGSLSRSFLDRRSEVLSSLARRSEVFSSEACSSEVRLRSPEVGGRRSSARRSLVRMSEFGGRKSEVGGRTRYIYIYIYIYECMYVVVADGGNPRVGHTFWAWRCLVCIRGC